MTDLAKKKCVPCEGGVPPLNEHQAKELLAELSDTWRIIGHNLTGEFKFKEYGKETDFVQSVMKLAIEEDHHPDLNVRYGKVRIDLFTHAIRGLSENDFILAAKIDQLSDTKH